MAVCNSTIIEDEECVKSLSESSISNSCSLDLSIGQLSPIIGNRRQRLQENLDQYDRFIFNSKLELSTELTTPADFGNEISLYFEPLKKRKSGKNEITNQLNRTIELSKCNSKIWHYDKTCCESNQSVINVLVERIRKEYNNCLLECSLANTNVKVIIHLAFNCILKPENMTNRIFRIYSPYKITVINGIQCYYNVSRIIAVNKK